MTNTELATIAGVIVNFLLFVVVIVQAEINRRQLKAMQVQSDAVTDTLSHTRRAFQIAERAYLGVLKIEPNEMGLSFHNGYFLHIVNGGRTPAWDVHMGGQCVFAGSDDIIHYPGVGNATEGVFLAPGSTIALTVSFPDTPNERQYRTGHPEEGKYFIVGEARYRDFDDSVHVFRFVYQCELPEKTLTALTPAMVNWEASDASTE